jgi:hypothetical protein
MAINDVPETRLLCACDLRAVNYASVPVSVVAVGRRCRSSLSVFRSSVGLQCRSSVSVFGLQYRFSVGLRSV